MAALQFEGEGKLARKGDRWLIELNDQPVGLDEGTRVGVVVWDRRQDGERSELEEIARVQQLEIPVVSHGLLASAAIREHADEFAQRLRRNWESA